MHTPPPLSTEPRALASPRAAADLKLSSDPHAKLRNENAWTRTDRVERFKLLALPVLLGLAILAAVIALIYALSSN